MATIKKPIVVSTSSKVLTKNVISTVVHQYEIKDWLSILVELFRTTCKFEMPTRRYGNIRIKTNDGKLLMDFVMNRIEQIPLPKNAPLGPIKYTLSHKSATGTPKNIPTSFGLPTNPGNLAILGSDKQVTITGDVIEETYNMNEKSHHIYGHSFSRQLTTQTDETGRSFEECECMLLEYNSGTLEFVTVDDYSPQELLDHFKLTMHNYSKSIRDQWVSRFQFLLGRGELVLNGRFAVKYSELIFEIASIKYPAIRQSKTTKNGNLVVMSFANATKQEIMSAIQSTLTIIDELL
jgi:hypothetical protein